MSAAPEHDDQPHEGPIRTPKQLVVAVVLSFVIPIVVISMLASFVASGNKSGAGSELLAPEAVGKRLQPVGQVTVKDPGDASALKSGEQVYTAVCAACHAAGVANAPKFGEAGAWAERLATGYGALLNSALKGKGAMGAQGGGDYSDVEIGRAVVHMANAAGGKFAEPALPAAKPAN